MNNRLPYIYVLLGAVLWGTTGTAQSFLPESVHPLAIGASRLAVGGYVLLLLMLLLKKIDFKSWPWKATIYSAIAMAIFQPFFFTSVRLTGIAIGTVVAIGSAPVFSGLLEWIFQKRKPDRVWLNATILAIIGVLLLFLTQGDVVVNPVGILMSLGAGLAFAIYTIVSKRVLDEVDAIPAVAMIFSISATILLPSLLIFNTEGLYTSKGLMVILYLGLAATSISYILFSSGLKRIPSSSAVTLSLAEPLTAALLGVFFIGEKLSYWSWSGVALLLCGILVLTFSGKKSV